MTVSKILVTTGMNYYGQQITSEMVDLTVKGGNKCNNWSDFPTEVFGATGGLIGSTVIICGGWKGGSLVDECYSLTFDKATLVTHMSVGRGYAASIVLNDKTLWVTGGWNDGYLASTEYVTTAGTIPGPWMPKVFYKHIMVGINSTVFMVIGNLADDGIFYYDHIEGKWIDGPSLIQARGDQAAGIVTDEVTNENFVAITGGAHYSDFSDFTEILQDEKWVQGKINYIVVNYCCCTQFS